MRVKSWPLRALRVGSTQSNMSMPRATHSTRSSRRARAHQVARPVGGQPARAVCSTMSYMTSARLADAQAADGVGLEPDVDGAPGALARAGPGRRRPGRCRTAPAPGLVSGDAVRSPCRAPSSARNRSRPRRAHRTVRSIDARAVVVRRGVREALVEAPSRCRSRAAPGCRRPSRATAGARCRRGASGTRRPPRVTVRRSARLNTW